MPRPKAMCSRTFFRSMRNSLGFRTFAGPVGRTQAQHQRAAGLDPARRPASVVLRPAEVDLGGALHPQRLSTNGPTSLRFSAVAPAGRAARRGSAHWN